MPNFPFQRAKPLGWSLFEVLTSAQMNIADANAAQAADGLVWTDVAQFRNWGQPQTRTNTVKTGFYNSVSGVWTAMGIFSGAPSAAIMTGASGNLTSIVTSFSSNLTARARAADYNPIADVGLIGGLPSASSAKKYVIFPTAFTSNMNFSSSQTNTTAVACIKWVSWANAGAGMWISGHEGTGVVETSPAGTVWTSRTVPNANARSSCAYSPSSIVITSSVQTDKVIQSSDGITWTERTMPSVQTWSNVVWIPLLGKFMAIANSTTGLGSSGFSAVAVSIDGITWVDQPFTLPANIGSINFAPELMAVAFGRTVFTMVSLSFISGMAMIYSQDGGLTWKYAAGLFPSSAEACLLSNGKQMLYGDGTSYYTTIGGGF
jgi:hypothetical protein